MSSGTEGVAVGHHSEGATAQRDVGRAVLSSPIALLFATIVGATVVRILVGSQLVAPSVLPDELLYRQAALRFEDGLTAGVGDAVSAGIGPVYPLLIAPAWILLEDPVRAYHLALAINAVLMSATAVPAYVLARMFVAQRSAVVVAALSVLIPSMTYAGLLMTENAFYPAFVATLLVIARAIERPTAGRQAAVLACLCVLGLIRVQGLALACAYLGAVLIAGLTLNGGRRRVWFGSFKPSIAAGVIAFVALALRQVGSGSSPFDALGLYAGTFDDLRWGEAPVWLAYLVGDLSLYLAVAPLIATCVVIGLGLARRDRRASHFAAISLPTLTTMLIVVVLVSAGVDVDGRENLNERYLFYVVPIALIGMALWFELGCPRPRWGVAVAVLLALLPVAIPINDLTYNAGFQSLALLPWRLGSPPDLAIAVVVGLFTLGCVALWVRAESATRRRIWVFVGAWFCVLTFFADGSRLEANNVFHRAWGDHDRRWVDRAVSDTEDVIMLWDGRSRYETDRVEPGYWTVMQTQALNRRVRGIYRLGMPTYYESVLPTRPVALGSEGAIRYNGRPLDVDYVIAACNVGVVGMKVRRFGGFVLYRTPGELHVGDGRRC